jgi:hypothetical protein
MSRLRKVIKNTECFSFIKTSSNDNWGSDYRTKFVMNEGDCVLLLEQTSSTSVVIAKNGCVTIIKSENLVGIR